MDDWRTEQLAILRELAELNMRLARAVVARAEAAAEQMAEPETDEEARDVRLWRGWELPPHDPGPPDKDTP